MAGGPNLESSPLQLKQLFFNNLQLLGFDAPAMEASNHIPFNKTMFHLPNKRGAEIVLQFLFNRLNPTMCREAFRDCWPILDKKKEREFRKTCSNWLTNITREEADSHLPRINASLFMSPGGDKFYELMFQFSGYVLQKVIDGELGCKSVDRLKYPALTSQNIQLIDVIMKDITCSSIRHRHAYFQTSQQTLKANTLWKETANDYVREYRKLNKGLRELDYKIREEQQRATEMSRTRSSDHSGVARRSQSEQFDPQVNPQTIRRAQQIQQVRDMWKKLEDFDRSEAAEREVIESIVERTIQKQRLDAADISVKVPDMLLRECAEEIRRRNVDNTYQGGKLNLVSVLQLWNLSLNLYLEKLRQVGVPKFEDDVKKVMSQVHTQQNYYSNAQTLRQQMSERVPVMKSTIEKLREKLDGMFFGEKTPDSIRTTSIGLDLVEPSPQPSFSPEAGKTPAGGIGVPRSPDNVGTPEAAARISEDVMASVRQGPKQLFQESDIAHIQQLAQHDNHRKVDKSIPQPGRREKTSRAGSRQTSRPTSARSLASSTGGNRSNRTTPTASPRVVKPSLVVKEPRPTSANSDWSQRSVQGSVQSQGSQGSRPSDWSKRSLQGSIHSQELERSQAGSVKSERSASSRPYSARSDSSQLSRSSQRSQGSEVVVKEMEDTERKTAADYLVDEILGEADILSPYNSGLEAFVGRERVARTPELDGDDNKENIVPGGDSTGAAGVPGTPTRGHQPEFQDVLGPELEESYDNGDSDDTARSEEHVIIIDRSLHQSPRPAVHDDGGLFGSPEATIDQERFPSLGGSPISPPTSPTGAAIFIDRSFHQFDKDNSPRLDPDYQDYTLPDGGEIQWNLSGINKGLTPSQTDILQQSANNSMTAVKPAVVRPLLPDSIKSPLSEEIRKMFQDALANTSLPQEMAGSSQFVAGSPRGVVGSPRGAVRSPRGAVGSPRGAVGFPRGAVGSPCGAVGSPRGAVGFPRGAVGSPRSTGNQTVGLKMGQKTPGTPVTGNRKISENGNFDEQAEGLIIGQDITRRDSDYFSHSAYLSQKLQELDIEAEGLMEQEIPESPEVLDILRGVQSLEEQLFAVGTPLESDSELEMPNMDLLSRLDARNKVADLRTQVLEAENQRLEARNQVRDFEADLDVETSGKLKFGDISWDFTENLADIELPDIDLDKAIDDIVENISVTDISGGLNTSSGAGRGGFAGDTVNIDDFFTTKTPELRKRTQRVATPGRGEGDGGTGDSFSQRRSPHWAPVDESPLISFTP